MSLDTFANLKLAIASWLNRSDLTANIPDFITLNEAELNRRIRSRRKTARADFTISSEFMSVPTDFSSVVTFRISSTDPDAKLIYVDPDDAADMIAGDFTTAAQPQRYTIVGSEFQFIAAPDGTYTAKLTYRQKITALSDTATSNWVLTDHPDLYLYGALVHAAPFLKDDNRVTVWGAMFERAIASLEKNDALENFGGKLNARARNFG